MVIVMDTIYRRQDSKITLFFNLGKVVLELEPNVNEHFRIFIYVIL